jgi:23S rRNA (uracil1939-C5)-methyltransferase
MSDVIRGLCVEKLTNGGYGLARHKGFVYFIPYSCPGDVLDIKVTDRKKNFAFAEIVNLVQASPDRVEPPCEYFGRCGGCDWQHINLPTQQSQKQLIVEEQLKDFITSETEIKPLKASPQAFNYRNRIQLNFDQNKFGYYGRGTHSLIPIKECLIAETALNEKLGQLPNLLAKQKKLTAGRLELALSQSGQVELFLSDHKRGKFDGFSQVNTPLNQFMIETVLEWVNPQARTVFDLYAGAGNFTFPLFNHLKKAKIISVEGSQFSCAKAHKTLQSLNLSTQKISFHNGDVESFLARAEIPEASSMLLDPPRAGCSDNVISSIASGRWEQLLYISCDIASLKRDLERLFSRSNRPLRLTRVQALDMFPQTRHVETLVEVLIDR